MLNIVNKSPLDRGSLDSCLQSAGSGAILLIEDGVYAATRGSIGETKLKAAAGRFKLFALGPDMEARGIADRAMDGLTLVDYAGFVDLVAEYNTCQSWL
ncbi:MAG: sulfurtransferase complex subunit TusB [Rhodocyclaceae bacterium]|nr:sulfurtransferase complex subunit TusB [Rhodocyclaceae bacterium]